jgi:glycosyltransferase involved in cell wall biosynthesis
MIKISAVICTFKRPDYLRLALRSLCNQTLSRDDYEIIVVDNAVDAEVEQIVKGFDDGNINLCYVPEEKIGLSRARNTGLKVAAGRYVAYIDDDARADDRWLESLVSAFERTSAAAVGGRVWLDWHGDRPAWVPDAQLSLFTFVDHGEEGHALRADEYLVGANVAFGRDTLISIGGFATNLGRQGTALLSGEEAAVLQHLRKRDFVIYYEPAALVWHSVHPSRKRPSWLLRRIFWDGASQPLLDRARRSRPALVRAVMFDLRQCLRWAASAVAATVRGRKESAWQSVLSLSQRAGRVRSELLMLTVDPS